MNSPISLDVSIEDLIKGLERRTSPNKDLGNFLDQNAITSMTNIFKQNMQNNDVCDKLRKIKGVKYLPLITNEKSEVATMNSSHTFHVFKRDNSKELRSFLQIALIKIAYRELEEVAHLK